MLLPRIGTESAYSLQAGEGRGLIKFEQESHVPNSVSAAILLSISDTEIMLIALAPGKL